MLRTRQILQMLDAGTPQRAICAEVHCSRRMVSAVKKRADETGRGNGELSVLADAELETIFNQAGSLIRKMCARPSWSA